jgi:hypothetical protein
MATVKTIVGEAIQASKDADMPQAISGDMIRSAGLSVESVRAELYEACERHDEEKTKYSGVDCDGNEWCVFLRGI